MFESIINFFKNMGKSEKEQVKSKDAAKERLHLVLMQDRANVSADFLDLMKQEIIEVIKKYIDVDENAIDVRLTNKSNSDGTTGAPALYANIPIVSIKEEVKSGMAREGKNDSKEEDKSEIDVKETSNNQEELSDNNLNQEEIQQQEQIIEQVKQEEVEKTENIENVQEILNTQEGENKEINTNYSNNYNTNINYNTINYNKENEEQAAN